MSLAGFNAGLFCVSDNLVVAIFWATLFLKQLEHVLTNDDECFCISWMYWCVIVTSVVKFHEIFWPEIFHEIFF